MNQNIQYRRFDIIKIKKLHANKIFKSLNKKKNIINFNDDKFIKKRPAIILKTFKNGDYLILPLTTKPIRNPKVHSLLREKIEIKDLKDSYLMFDSILRIRNNQILGIYSKGKGKNFVVLSNSTKKWILKTAKNKITKIFN
ncbi:hypothetical protein mflW37_3660 [Mesoplasma florum W37]|uniref:Uncharacterized protein n=1 Tax=Mesoplasma florum TaxID=2151 RepID=A0AAD0HS49_MESFO|nr:hypothetical protein [Mesoplasma florum]AGY41433.1 hypothetical protein mflW37_3660 [Mesoplasma florum W37]AVN59651.1 hypothetical protein CG008_01900 [Mesoplasma florum]AVN65773.1 hypothetical protein MflW12_3680 [Mesoplasma florum]